MKKRFFGGDRNELSCRFSWRGGSGYAGIGDFFAISLEFSKFIEPFLL